MIRKKEFHSECTVAQVYQILDAWNHKGLSCCKRNGNAFWLSIGTMKPFQRSSLAFQIEGSVDPAENGTTVRYSIQPAWQSILLLSIPLLALLSGLIRLLAGNGSPAFVLIALAVNGLLWLWTYTEMQEYAQKFTDRIYKPNIITQQRRNDP